MEFLTQDPQLTLLIIILVFLVGKEFFLKKEDKSKMEQDICAVSSKGDSSISILRQECTGAINNLQLQIKDDFTSHSDKFYGKISETLDKIDQKYVSKEIQKQQDDRMNKFEKRLDNIENVLGQVKTITDINTTKLDNIIDMLNQQ